MDEGAVACDEISSSIRARHLQTPLTQALVFRSDDTQERARQALVERDFDQAPVFENGHLVGYVVRSDLTLELAKPLTTRIRPLTSSTLVTGDAPIGKLLTWLGATPFMFVIQDNQVTGLLTAADINRQPGRTYFFLLLAEFELVMSDLIRAHFALDQTAMLALLRDVTRRHLLSQLDRDRNTDVVAELVAYLHFADLLRVVGCTTALLTAFDMTTKSQWNKQTGALDTLRNKVCHSTRPLLKDGRSIATLIDLDRRLHRLLSTTPIVWVSRSITPRPTSAGHERNALQTSSVNEV